MYRNLAPALFAPDLVRDCKSSLDNIVCTGSIIQTVSSSRSCEGLGHRDLYFHGSTYLCSLDGSKISFRVFFMYFWVCSYGRMSTSINGAIDQCYSWAGGSSSGELIVVLRLVSEGTVSNRKGPPRGQGTNREQGRTESLLELPTEVNSFEEYTTSMEANRFFVEGVYFNGIFLKTAFITSMNINPSIFQGRELYFHGSKVFLGCGQNGSTGTSIEVADVHGSKVYPWKLFRN